MSIKGIGTDIVDKNRIANLLDQHGERFVKRILSEQEQQVFAELGDPVAYLARRFAAKEAVAKAFGTGIGKLAFNEICIMNLSSGKPVVNFIGESAKVVATIPYQDVMISLSDEKHYAVAFVIVI
jgi:holo-[acyl-carrier protein] synthase